MSNQAPGPSELRHDRSLNNEQLQLLLARQQEIQAEIAALLPSPHHQVRIRKPTMRRLQMHKLEQPQQQEECLVPETMSQQSVRSTDSGYKSDTVIQTSISTSKVGLELSNDEIQRGTMGTAPSRTRQRSRSRDSAYASKENTIQSPIMPEDLNPFVDSAYMSKQNSIEHGSLAISPIPSEESPWHSMWVSLFSKAEFEPQQHTHSSDHDAHESAATSLSIRHNENPQSDVLSEVAKGSSTGMEMRGKYEKRQWEGHSGETANATYANVSQKKRKVEAAQNVQQSVTRPKPGGETASFLVAGRIGAGDHEGSLSPAPQSTTECTNLLGRDSSPATLLENCMGQSQASFSTHSSLSEDATDWEEDSDEEQSFEQPDLRGPSRLTDELRGTILQDALDPTRKAIVDRLMEEFWVIFNQNWQSGFRFCTSGSSNPLSKPGGISSAQGGSQTVPGGSGNAQNCGGGDDGTEGNQEKENGEPSNPPDLQMNADQPLGFACPYRKRNPRKYCVSDWRSCALSPLKTIARVKGHLYRYHTIHQCPRCKSLFSLEAELDSHIMSSERCDAILSLPVDGITSKMKAALQCKRKAFPGQTEAERWKQIYQILFPDEEVPDPYFEQVRDIESRSRSPDLTNIANYEQFLRRNLPQLVRSAILAELNNEIQPIEDRLRDQLPGLVENALSRASLEYHTIVNESDRKEHSSDSGYASNSSRAGSSQDPKGKESADGSQPEMVAAITDADLSNHADASDASLPLNFETDPEASSFENSVDRFENSAYYQQNFENFDAIDYSQLGVTKLSEFFSAEAFADNSSWFSDWLKSGK